MARRDPKRQDWPSDLANQTSLVKHVVPRDLGRPIRGPCKRDHPPTRDLGKGLVPTIFGCLGVGHQIPHGPYSPDAREPREERFLAPPAQNVIFRASRKTRPGRLRLEHDIEADYVSPSRGLRREERLGRLQQALDRLSSDHRQVIMLARIRRLQVREIAGRMKRSENAVKKLLARALDELRKEFGDTESLNLPDVGLDLREDDR